MIEVLLPSVCLIVLYAAIGGGIAWVVGLRGLWIAAVAPAFATTVIAAASTIAPWLGMQWSILPVVIVAVAVAAVIAGVRWVVRRHHPAGSPAVVTPATPDRRSVVIALILVVAVALLAWRTAEVIGAPDAISQTFDNVFHLNAIRYALDVGTISPLQIGQMTSPNGGVPFYPSAWHATAALVVQLTGASIPVAVNALTLVIAAVIWPLGAVILVRVLGGRSVYATAGAALVATAIPAFPFLPMDYGVLYPYQLALALLPVALAATAALVRIGDAGDGMTPGWWALTVVGIVPGLALAHPGGMLGWLALSVPIVIVLVWRVWCRGGPRARVLLSAGVVIYLILGVLLLKVLRPPLPTRMWPTATDPLSAVQDVATVTLYYPASAAVVAIGVLLGLVWCAVWRTGSAFVQVGMWLIGAVLFVVVISSSWQTLRDALTGGWYNNWPRLAALFAVALVPLAATGWASTVQWASRRVSDAPAVRGTIAAAAFVVLAVIAQGPVGGAVVQAHRQFALNGSSALLSSDEMMLLQRLDETTPADAVIAGNPYTGTSLAYAIADRRVLMPHILVDVSDDMAQVNDELAQATEGSAVCAAVAALGVGYVLDFGDREVHGESHELAGLTDLDDSTAVRLIDQQGDARLFEITACDRE